MVGDWGVARLYAAAGGLGSRGVGHVTKIREKWTNLPTYAKLLLQVESNPHLEMAAEVTR
jgi:hypothetical protein